MNALQAWTELSDAEVGRLLRAVPAAQRLVDVPLPQPRERDMRPAIAPDGRMTWEARK